MTDPTQRPDTAQRIQLPPVGPEPDPTGLFLCAVMRSSDQKVVKVAALVYPDDLDPPASLIFGTAVALAGRHIAPSPAIILDDLQRTGQLTEQVQQYLLQAITTGAEWMMIREYGAAVVAGRLRALYESFGHALTTGANTIPESSLPQLAERAAKTIRTVADRLDILRGGAA